ncbi:MAG: long-chain fatty acid--CoA ligase, partial [Massilibacteroides sp.]|nr:long-chain fatty acid--CoA ligase [Massilibacteroides sp.]
LYNNQSPYTTAMVVPNLAFLKSYVEEKGLNWGERAVVEEAIKEIDREISQFKKGGALEERFPERWLPTTFILLPEPFTEQNGLVNSTMKVMRNKVEAHYAEELKFLYTPEGKNILNDKNRQALEE